MVEIQSTAVNADTLARDDGLVSVIARVRNSGARAKKKCLDIIEITQIYIVDCVHMLKQNNEKVMHFLIN